MFEVLYQKCLMTFLINFWPLRFLIHWNKPLTIKWAWYWASMKVCEILEKLKRPVELTRSNATEPFARQLNSDAGANQYRIAEDHRNYHPGDEHSSGSAASGNDRWNLGSTHATRSARNGEATQSSSPMSFFKPLFKLPFNEKAKFAKRWITSNSG